MNYLLYTSIILVVLLTLSLTGCKSVHTELVMQAPVEKVWQTISQTDEYDRWNPVIKEFKGKVEAGEDVSFLFIQSEDKSYTISAKIKQIKPNELLNQGGGIPLILTYDHKYILEAVPEGTKVTIHEDYRGIGVWFWSPAPVEKAYIRLNEAIREEVEK